MGTRSKSQRKQQPSRSKGGPRTKPSSGGSGNGFEVGQRSASPAQVARQNAKAERELRTRLLKEEVLRRKQLVDEARETLTFTQNEIRELLTRYQDAQALLAELGPNGKGTARELEVSILKTELQNRRPILADKREVDAKCQEELQVAALELRDHYAEGRSDSAAEREERSDELEEARFRREETRKQREWEQAEAKFAREQRQREKEEAAAVAAQDARERETERLHQIALQRFKRPLH